MCDVCGVWCVMHDIQHFICCLLFRAISQQPPGSWLPLHWHQSPALDLQLETVILPCPLRAFARLRSVFSRAKQCFKPRVVPWHVTRAMLQVWMLQTGALTLLGQNPSQLAQ